MLGFNLGLARPSIGAGGPSVLYDFATGAAVPDSFARASPAWDLDLTQYDVDQPRVKGGVGLLLEEAATNIVPDSAAFALDPSDWASAWIRDPVRPIAPDGTATGVELIAPNSDVVLRNLTPYIPGGAFSFSVYVQSEPLAFDVFPLFVRNDTVGAMVDGTELPLPLVAGDHGAFKVRPGPGSWWRLSGTIPAGFDPDDALGLYLGATGWNLNGKRIRLWGLTITAGQVVGSPILTPPSAGATRAAESGSLIVPSGCTRWTAAYGAAEEASGTLSESVFDLTAPGRPWIGLGHELRWLRMQ